MFDCKKKASNVDTTHEPTNDGVPDLETDVQLDTGGISCVVKKL